MKCRSGQSFTLALHRFASQSHAWLAMLSGQRCMTLWYSQQPGLPEFWISVHGVLACARSFNVFPTIAVSIGSTRPALSGVSITP
jgi:hypothetical protein